MTVKEEEKNGAHILIQDTTHSNNKNDVSNRKMRKNMRIIEDILLLDCICRLNDIQKKIEPLQKEEAQLLL